MKNYRKYIIGVILMTLLVILPIGQVEAKSVQSSPLLGVKSMSEVTQEMSDAEINTKITTKDELPVPVECSRNPNCTNTIHDENCNGQGTTTVGCSRNPNCTNTVHDENCNGQGTTTAGCSRNPNCTNTVHNENCNGQGTTTAGCSRNPNCTNTTHDENCYNDANRHQTHNNGMGTHQERKHGNRNHH